MTESSALNYNKLIIESRRLGRRMKILDHAVKHDMEVVFDQEMDENQLHETSVRLYGIGSVLELLRATPNAYLNQEAMEALRGEVEDAAKIERSDWAKAIFETADPTVW